MLYKLWKTIILLPLENNMTMFDTVTVTYNVQCLQGKKFVLILKHDLSDIHEAQLLLDNCYKLDPNGVYQIVEHWK